MMEGIMQDVVKSIEQDDTVELSEAAIEKVKANEKSVLGVFDKLDMATEESDNRIFERFKVYATNVNQRRLSYTNEMKLLMQPTESEVSSVSTAELNALRNKAEKFDENRIKQREASRRAQAKKKEQLKAVG